MRRRPHFACPHCGTRISGQRLPRPTNRKPRSAISIKAKQLGVSYHCIYYREHPERRK